MLTMGFDLNSRPPVLSPYLLLLTVTLATRLLRPDACFRDVDAGPFWLQAWLFVTPIAYSSSLIPAPWRSTYGGNPIGGHRGGIPLRLGRATPAPRPRLWRAPRYPSLLGLLPRRTEAGFADSSAAVREVAIHVRDSATVHA